MATIFVAEVISDGPAFGTNLQSRINSISALFSGNSIPPVGTVEYRTGGATAEGAVTGFAAPLFPYMQQIPLVGEYILCIGTPMPTGDGPTSAEAFFYIGPIMIDGSRNRNLAPGSFQRSASPLPISVSPIPPKFPRKSIPKMQPFIGDTIIEDRHGSVIRMSATQLPTAIAAPNPSVSPEKAAQFPWRAALGAAPPPNPITPPWVTPYSAGSPIMVLSVGNLGKQSGQLAGLARAVGPPQTLVESIETDLSAIYLTSDQSLNFTLPFPPGIKELNPIGTSVKSLIYKHGTDLTRSTKPDERVGDKKGGPDESLNGTVRGQVGSNTAISIANPNPSSGTDFILGATFPLPIPGGAGARVPGSSQILMRSHRIILHARLDNVLIAARKDIKLGTENWRMELDSSMFLINELFNQVILLSMHCQELTDILCEHMKVTTQMQFPTGVGPTGPALEFYKNQIDVLRSKLGGKSDGAKSDLPIVFEPSTTFTRFEERAAHVQELLKEFSIQRRSQSEKDENNKNAEAKGS